MPEFYLKQLEYKGKMLEFAEKINFFAPESRQIFVDWVNSLSIDWPISRRRYYATEIPLWYCKKCNEPILPPKGKYCQPWKEQPPKEALKGGKCPKCSAGEFKGEERVFDTWFDSSISPLYILGYERHPEFFKKHLPCSLRPQGKEIVRTWLYYTVLKDYLLTGKLIFRDAWINYHVVDENGEKMSKSKGNVIDPKEVLDKFGAEPFRLWAAVEGNLEKTDFRCSFERIEGSAKTLTKLWNVSRFISGFENKKVKKPALWEIDKWIIGELNGIVRFSRERFEQYDFHNPAIRIKSFLWNEFASHYLEMVKSRAYNNNKEFSEAEQQAAVFTLNHCLGTMLLLLAPITPFITALLYEKLSGKDAHFEQFPEASKELDFKVGFESSELMELNSAIWKKKKDRGMPLNKEIDEITASEKFRGIERTLLNAHRAKKIVYTK
ncbi:MAG: class I tRNA ligase family protein, partial [Candidatus Diapherotrites archaeon]|nr:class I tRNA ligase family protein [Candidatus Diapherotrites archaeon]